MTDREARIEKLVAEPPTLVLTRWQKVERVVAWMAAAIAIAALVIGVTNLEKTAAQASCTNSTLGARARATLEQNKAAEEFARADKRYNEVFYDLLFVHPPKTAAEKAAARALFKRVQARKVASSTRWFTELVTLVRIAERTPLGQC